jgi:hypothetical protein
MKIDILKGSHNCQHYKGAGKCGINGIFCPANSTFPKKCPLPDLGDFTNGEVHINKDGNAILEIKTKPPQ